MKTAAGTVYEADALIGADGIRSMIREQMTGGDPLRVSGHVAYRAVLPIEQMPEDLRWNAAAIWVGPKTPFRALSAAGLEDLQPGRDLRHRS